MAVTTTTKRTMSDEEAAATLTRVAGEMRGRSNTLRAKVNEEIEALNEINDRAMEELKILKDLKPSPLTRTKTIRPAAPSNVPFVAIKPSAIKPSDYLTPRHTGRAKKKARAAPPQAPRIRPVPSDLTRMEVIDLTASDARIVYDLTGTPGETPGRVTKTAEDVFVEFDGIKLSMNSVFGECE